MEEALDVVGENPVENRALGTTWPIDAGTRCGGGRLSSEE
jgi:hypothetical protein